MERPLFHYITYRNTVDRHYKRTYKKKKEQNISLDDDEIHISIVLAITIKVYTDALLQTNVSLENNPRSAYICYSKLL